MRKTLCILADLVCFAILAWWSIKAALVMFLIVGAAYAIRYYWRKKS